MANFSQKSIKSLLHLRLLVSRLGEKDHFDWWSTNSLSEVGVKYHKILFPRTYASSSSLVSFQAAKSDHDKGVGAPRSFHLFRLPVEIEKRILDELSDLSSLPSGNTKAECMTLLQEAAGGSQENNTGPIRVGGINDITKPSIISRIAGAYLNAFSSGDKCIPYFSDA